MKKAIIIICETACICAAFSGYWPAIFLALALNAALDKTIEKASTQEDGGRR